MTMGADDFAPIRFSTINLPERDKMPMWCEAFSRNVLKVDVAPLDATSFHAELAMLALPGLGISWGQNSGQRAERTRRLVADGDDDLCLMMAIEGSAVVKQVGREALLCSEGAVMVSGAETGLADCTDGFTHLTLKLPRRELASRVVDIDRAIVQSLGANTEALELLRAYVLMLRQDLTPVTPELRQLAVTHVYDLVALGIGATREAAELAQTRGVRAARVREILSQIKSGFAEPSFSPGTVAANLRLSPRYLQDLLQDTGESFTERVLEMRLQKARRMLVLPVNDRLTVSDIAYACGFNEVSYFNRRFRRRFGAPPSHFRGKGADS